MLKLFGISRDPEPVLPDDTLSPTSHLLRGKTVFQTQAGIPTSADGLAYDPVQRLLAVSIAPGTMSCRAQEAMSNCKCCCDAGQHKRWPHQSAGPRRGGRTAYQHPSRTSTNTTTAVRAEQGRASEAGPGVLDSQSLRLAAGPAVPQLWACTQIS